MRRTLWLSGMVLCAAALSACGGSHGSLPPVPLSQQNPGMVPTPPAQSANATFSFVIPTAAKAQTLGVKKPSYISPSTLSISLALSTVNGATPNPVPTAQVVNVTSSTNGCSADTNNVGNTKCTVSMHIPVGTDAINISTYDANNAGGNLLSKQIYSASVVAGTANSYTFALDANPANASIAVAATGTATGSQGAGFAFALAGGAQTFSVTLKDAANNTLVGPGQPTLSGSSDATGVATASITGNTLTVTPVAGGTAHITVTAAPANSQTTSDGLSNGTATFTVTVSAATPTPTPTPTLQPLLAIAGTNTNSSPQSSHIYLYNYGSGAFTLSGVVSDTTLGQAGFGTDPTSIAFDPNGNLYEVDYGLNHALRFSHSSIITSSPSVTTTFNQDIISPYTISGAADGSALAVLLNQPQAVEFSSAGQTGNTVTSLYFLSDGITGGIVGTFIPGASGFSTDSYAFVLSANNSTSKIGLCNGTPSSCTPTFITNGVNSPQYGISFLVWDSSVGRLYLANTKGGDGTHGVNNLVYYTFSSGTPSSPTTLLASQSLYPTALAARDGYVAVSVCALTPNFTSPGAQSSDSCSVYVYDSTGTLKTGWNPKTITDVTSLGFLQDDSLLVGTSATAPGKITLYDLSGNVLAGPQTIGSQDIPIGISVYP